MAELNLYILIIGALILAVVVFRAQRGAARQQEQTVAQALSSYQQALARLRAEPHRQELRQQALDAGRRYARLAREQATTTAYDEATILNDINAAAGPTAAIAAPAAPTIEERLQTLEGLRTRGLITEDEYAARRQALINEL